MSVSGIFDGLELRGGDHLKSQYLFSDFYEGYGFFGQLRTLTTMDMYAVKLGSATELNVHGQPVVLPKSLTIGSGW